jgi:hypothetical protein
MKFHKNPSSCSMRKGGQTVMTKPIAAFRNFVKAPKSGFLRCQQSHLFGDGIDHRVRTKDFPRFQGVKTASSTHQVSNSAAAGNCFL